MSRSTLLLSKLSFTLMKKKLINRHALGKNNKVSLISIPDHFAIEGNKKANQLAKRGL